jgi:hypothetical protein
MTIKSSVVLALVLVQLFVAGYSTTAHAYWMQATDKNPTINQLDDEGGQEPCPDPDGDGICNPLPPLTED